VRGRTSGVDVDVPAWAMVWTLRGGKVVRMRIYPDHAGALEAVGLPTSE
jgi:ketosteroid isomerase-like protein